MDEMTPDVLEARAYLSRVSEPASIPVWAFVRRVGPVAAVAAIRRGQAPPEVGHATAARAAVADPWADLEAAERHRLRLVAPESDEWPHFALLSLERAAVRRLGEYEAGKRTQAASGEPMPPLALWVGGPGDLATLGVRSVGMVGSRAATPYGEHVTTQLCYELAGQGVVVVSGGAYGIDAAAHRGALAAAGETVLVSAGGLDSPYPAGNAQLYERVADSGLVVSESPPGCAPQRHRFLTRNRLIAAFSTGTVVVEAARRSGALNTAAHCTRLGRPLLAVPGPVTSAMSLGCHDLIRRDVDPAILVNSADDVLAVVGRPGEGIDARREPSADELQRELDALDPVARRIFDGLRPRKFSRLDEIAQRSGLPPSDVFRALPGLELARLIEVSDAGYRIAAHLRSVAS